MKRAICMGLVLLVACSRFGTTRGWGTLHEMTIARANVPSSLNPLFAYDQPDIDITQLYAEPLVGLNARNQPIPIVVATALSQNRCRGQAVELACEARFLVKAESTTF